MLHDTSLLKQIMLDFIAKVDGGKSAEVIVEYDPAFLCIRVVDSGEFVNMNYNQMVSFWKMQSAPQPSGNIFSHKAIITSSTAIHYIEIVGDTANVLVTRVKDLGNGAENIFYNFIWINKNNKWYLFREFVHQRSMPKFIK